MMTDENITMDKKRPRDSNICKQTPSRMHYKPMLII